MIKRIDPKAVKKFVSRFDEAVDFDASDFVGFQESHDLSKLKIKEGMTPSFFLVKNVGAEDEARIRGNHQKITPATKDADGKPVAPALEIVDWPVMMVKYFKAAVSHVEENGVVTPINADEVPAAVIQEIGSFVFTRTVVGDQEKKS